MQSTWTPGICLSKFLTPGSSKDGVASGQNLKNPSHLSLIFITTLVNNYQMRLLIDTGATTTFINNRMLQHIKPYPNLTKISHSFVLADGIAPFHVLGVVTLRIKFANQTTIIQAHVAENLCTDVILGMDYISTYNLNFDLREHVVSIKYNNQQYFMNIDQEIKPRFIPVTLSIPLHIPPNSSRSALVSASVSPAYSRFAPHGLITISRIAVISDDHADLCCWWLNDRFYEFSYAK